MCKKLFVEIEEKKALFQRLETSGKKRKCEEMGR
jgi:hypothetical protein